MSDWRDRAVRKREREIEKSRKERQAKSIERTDESFASHLRLWTDEPLEHLVIRESGSDPECVTISAVEENERRKRGREALEMVGSFLNFFCRKRNGILPFFRIEPSNSNELLMISSPKIYRPHLNGGWPLERRKPET